ncbi:MAG: hypothetical protein WC881_09155 [Elusimicrobiota bacterium]|jgi:hypothetical protein
MEQKPQIPTLKDSKKPQLKIRGLASGLSLLDRMKQFKKKDLAFILAGLGVLVMAPLAEHFMMSPETGDSANFKPGWGFSSGRFGDGSSPYEGGVNGMAPGGSASGSDLITPLNVRDPASLIMGPGAQQQPAAGVTPPAKDSTDWKDALANAASQGASAATRAASLPVPKTSLTNAGLRGLGAAAGGGGGGYSLPALNAGNVPNRAAESNALQRVTAAPGYRGAGARGAQNASAGAMEALKKAAANAGSDFNRTGPAASALEAAASRQMPTGGGSGDSGAGGSGREDKGPGGGNDKSSKSMGESLEFMARKDWSQKMRDLAFEKLKKQEMMWPNLKDEIAKELVMSPIKALSSQMTDAFKDLGKDKSKEGKYKCEAWGEVKGGDVASECKNEKNEKPYCVLGMKDGKYELLRLAGGAKDKSLCFYFPGDSGGKGNATKGSAVDDVFGPPDAASQAAGAEISLDKLCGSLRKALGESATGTTAAVPGGSFLGGTQAASAKGGKSDEALLLKDAAVLQQAAKLLAGARNRMDGSDYPTCGIAKPTEPTVDAGLKASAQSLAEAMQPLPPILQGLEGYGKQVQFNLAPEAPEKTDSVVKALTAWNDKQTQGAKDRFNNVVTVDLPKIKTDLDKARDSITQAGAALTSASGAGQATALIKAHYSSLEAWIRAGAADVDKRGIRWVQLDGEGKDLRDKVFSDVGQVVSNAKSTLDAKVEAIKSLQTEDKVALPEAAMTVSEFNTAVQQAMDKTSLTPAPTYTDRLRANREGAVTANQPKVERLIKYVDDERSGLVQVIETHRKTIAGEAPAAPAAK